MSNDAEKVNELIDKMEAGELSRRDFLRGVAALGLTVSAIGPLVQASGREVTAQAKGQTRTGLLVRIQAVRGEGNLIEGVVKPGALEFSHEFTEGEWDQEITEGTAEVDVKNVKKSLKKSEKVKIKAKEKFKFSNKGKQRWRFQAKHPMWLPDRFSYEYQGKRISGSEMWFELKTSPDEVAKRPVYSVMTANKQDTFVVVSLDPGSETIPCYYTDGDNIITVVSGSGALLVNGTPRPLSRGGSATVKVSERFQVKNTSSAPMMVEVRPDKPRMWNPDASLWEVAAGNFVKGDQVWFEYVLPS
jgi:mannose-6-phosphate isomerase-like protein (cupin superfamily)